MSLRLGASQLRWSWVLASREPQNLSTWTILTKKLRVFLLMVQFSARVQLPTVFLLLEREQFIHQTFGVYIYNWRMKKTITLIQVHSDADPEQALVTHRLRPKRRSDFDAKSLSIGDKTVLSTNELLSSISPKLNARSISLSTESRLSSMILDKQQVQISCLDHLSIPNFSLAGDHSSLDFEELKRMAIRRKLKNLVVVPGCIQKVKKICCESNCQIKQRWMKTLVLEQRDLSEAREIRSIISSHTVKYEHQIDKDVFRSFTSNFVGKTKITLYHTTSEKNNIYEMLRLVLRMLAFSDPDVGYVQGMNLYVAVVVSHMKEVESSFVFVREIMKYGNMRNMYTNGFKKLKELAENLLHRHIRLLMNDLYQHLVDASVVSEIFMPFYLSMFACVIEYTLMPAIIDQFMARGFLFLDKLMISMLCFLKQELLETDAMEVTCKLGASYIRTQVVSWEEVLNLSQVIDLN